MIAAEEVVRLGGNAADAAVAAHAACAVLMPDACGLGGDALFLVRTEKGVVAVTGAGKSASGADTRPSHDGGASVTVPGAVGAWEQVSRRFGRVGLAAALAPAIRMAASGVLPSVGLLEAVAAQRARLERGGAGSWPVTCARHGQLVVQLVLAETLRDLAQRGSASFYGGSLAQAIVAAVVRDGGVMTTQDLHDHRTLVGEPVAVAWNGGTAYAQPSPSQGVLLAAALQWLEAHEVGPDRRSHVGVELTEAVFSLRERCATDGADLLDEPLEVDLERASRRGGPRAYLHTTGVATADRDGLVVSSLLSLFDDFGAATFVPEGGFVLNNRAGGFTVAPNEPGPSRRPVHTLAPLLLDNAGVVTALATPGADGQVQTLLQVLLLTRYAGADLVAALAAPRWRSENAQLLVARDHPDLRDLEARGHLVVPVDDADPRLGAVVCAVGALDRAPVAIGDWRRTVATGGA